MKVEIELGLLIEVQKAISGYDDNCQRESYYGVSRLKKKIDKLVEKEVSKKKATEKKFIQIREGFAKLQKMRESFPESDIIEREGL